MFTVIDLNTWERAEHYYAYSTVLNCLYSVTETIDVSNVVAFAQREDVRFYAIMLHIITKAVNGVANFRMDFNESKELGRHDRVVPMYTTFHKETQTFSYLWTDYAEDFATFYASYLEDQRRYGHILKFIAKDNLPPNAFSISCIPWSGFTSINYQIFSGDKFVKPVITFGRYTTNGSTTSLPLAVQIHHCVADGYHMSRVFEAVREGCAGFKG